MTEHQDSTSLELGPGKRKRSSSILASPHESGNLHAFRHNMLLDSRHVGSEGLPEAAQTSTVSLDNDSLYMKIITAISMSMSYLLARKNKCLTLSPGLLVKCESILGFDRSIPLEKAESLIDSQILPSFFLEAVWQPNGTLIIASYPYRENVWLQARTESVHTFNSVILAPFGWAVAILQPQESQKPHKHREKPHLGPKPLGSDWRRACTTLLERQGIHLTQGTRWIAVIPYDEPNSLDSIHQSFEWPMHLCFQGTTKDPCEEDMDELLWSWDERNAHIDPLIEAEKWFLEKDVRKVALEELQRQKKEVEKEESVESEEEEDLLANLRPRNEEVTNQQTPSGIYPTPPDGSKTQRIAPTSDYTRLGKDNTATVDQSTLRQGKGNNLGHGINETDVGNETGLGPYDPLEEEDLFGDMEGDIFADNGITEDDFSFFDNPGNSQHSELSVAHVGVEQKNQETRSEPKETLHQGIEKIETRFINGDLSALRKTSNPEELRSSPGPGREKATVDPKDTKSSKTTEAGQLLKPDQVLQEEASSRSLPLPFDSYKQSEKVRL